MHLEEQQKKDNYQMEELKSNKSLWNEETCPDCKGSGVSGDGTCSSCNGKGII